MPSLALAPRSRATSEATALAQGGVVAGHRGHRPLRPARRLPPRHRRLALDEPELHLRGGHVFVPDLAGWRRERMPTIPMHAAALELAPDWVCEIFSPSTAVTDRADKLPIDATESVAHVGS